MRNTSETEKFLEFLVKERNMLLHGSRTDFNGTINPKYSKGGIVSVTDVPQIALLNAILSDDVKLHFGTLIDQNHLITAEGFNDEKIGNGFVYLVDRRLFAPGSYQSNTIVPILGKLPVRKYDFVYPVYD